MRLLSTRVNLLTLAEDVVTRLMELINQLLLSFFRHLI